MFTIFYAKKFSFLVTTGRGFNLYSQMFTDKVSAFSCDPLCKKETLNGTFCGKSYTYPGGKLSRLTLQLGIDN